MPRLPKAAQIALAPDWVCEVLSRRTEATDRAEKMLIYAREGVRHAWLIHPIRRTLEVFALNAEGQWTVLAVHRGEKRVRADPFAEVELDLSVLWPEEGDAVDDEEADEAEAAASAAAPGPKGAPAKARKRARK
jgi:Uma2 family endonuclease